VPPWTWRSCKCHFYLNYFYKTANYKPVVHPFIHCTAYHFCLWEPTKADKPSMLQLAPTAALVLALFQKGQRGIASCGRFNHSFPSIHKALGPHGFELGGPAIKTISLLPAKMHFSSVLSLVTHQLHSVAAIYGHPIFMKCTAIDHSTCAYLT